MPTTILKIEHGSTDGRGRFRPASPLGRTVTRVGKANPAGKTEVVQTGDWRRESKWDVLMGGEKIGDIYYEIGKYAGRAKAPWGGYTHFLGYKNSLASARKAVVALYNKLHRGRSPNPSSLKALLGSGQWRKVKVRPIGEGKVQVLLTTGKGKGGGRRTPNPGGGRGSVTEESIARVKRDLPRLIARHGRNVYTVQLSGRGNAVASAAVTDERVGSGRGTRWEPRMGRIFHVPWEKAARAYESGSPLILTGTPNPRSRRPSSPSRRGGLSGKRTGNPRVRQQRFRVYWWIAGNEYYEDRWYASEAEARRNAPGEIRREHPGAINISLHRWVGRKLALGAKSKGAVKRR